MKTQPSIGTCEACRRAGVQVVTRFYFSQRHGEVELTSCVDGCPGPPDEDVERDWNSLMENIPDLSQVPGWTGFTFTLEDGTEVH